ncbi:hypothetical protein AVEN_72778-1 [Araneus ventricosus]|uniref:Uncharacterized protein n=1 Tax=Araneus ventricosus TaxID=182803 RepID=A0A4Y2QIX9_ARAVE|nr:hypothetical protein AVEN_72778-1 [Araneus ventricosus]
MTLCTPAEIPKRFIPNWKKFKQHLINQTEIAFTSKTKEDIDIKVEHLTAEIIKAYRDSDSWKDLINSETTEEIRLQVRERNKCKKWQRSRHQADKNRLNRVQSHLRKFYRDHDQRKWNNFITGIEPGDDSLWIIVNLYNNDRFKMPPIINSSKIAYKYIEKADKEKPRLGKFSSG